MKSYLAIVVDSKNAGTNWTLKENSQPTNLRKPKLNIKQQSNEPTIQTVIQLSSKLSSNYRVSYQLFKALSKASINHGVCSVQLIDGNGSPEIKQPTMKSTGLRTSQSNNCESTSQFKNQLTRPLSNQSLNKSNLSRAIAGRFNNLKTLLASALGVLTWIFLLCKSSGGQNSHDWR